jgi:salicylate hydroxylase
MSTGAEDRTASADRGRRAAFAVARGAERQGAPFFTHQVAWRALIPATPRTPPRWPRFTWGRGAIWSAIPCAAAPAQHRRGRGTPRWVEESWSLRDDPMELRLAFEGFGPRVRGWLDQVEDVPGFGACSAIRWRATGQGWLPEGAVAILGDAAHPTLPFLAQGASMGLEDAWVLAAPWPGMTRWRRAGWPIRRRANRRCGRIVEAANRNARAYHLSGPIARAGASGPAAGRKDRAARRLKRFDWLYGHDVTMCTCASAAPAART